MPNLDYDLEDIDGTKYAVVEDFKGKYSLKYMGHLKEGDKGDKVKAINLEAKQAFEMCRKHNDKLSGRAESFRDKHGIERTVADSDIR